MVDRISVKIPVFPWFRDHNINGRVVLPAVEIMLLLAGVASVLDGRISPLSMSQGKFLRLLEPVPGASELSLLVEHEVLANGILLRLLSKKQFAKISRYLVHAEIFFAFVSSFGKVKVNSETDSTRFTIDAGRIYRELVIFGPTYRTITGELMIGERHAIAELQAPLLPRKQAMEDIVGSPYPLDGAMHAACVLGQCMADFVPFPVAFEQRFVHRPTVAGAKYRCLVRAVARESAELVFDLFIMNHEDELYETVKGLRMMDVTGGVVKPAADLPIVKPFP